MGGFTDPTSSEFAGGGINGGLIDPLNLGGRPSGGLGGGKGNVPAAPDYMGIVTQMGNQQSDLLAQQTAANRPDINTPQGGYDWTQGADGQWSLDVSMSPEQQALYGQQTQIGQRANQAALGRLNEGIGGQRTEEALYRQMTSRMDPEWNRQQAQQRTQLYNTGLREGDTAYNDQMREFGRNRNDAYSQARLQAITGGDQSAAAKVNLINALRGGGQVSMPQQPGFSQAGQGQTPNLLGAAQLGYGADLNAYNAQQAQQQAMIQGGLQLLPLLFSDARLKTKIRRLPIEAFPGVPYASWEWKAGGRGFGVIAQDLQKVRPDLVVKGPGGYLMVDYNGIGGLP